jgi:hypothetical protein
VTLLTVDAPSDGGEAGGGLDRLHLSGVVQVVDALEEEPGATVELTKPGMNGEGVQLLFALDGADGVIEGKVRGFEVAEQVSDGCAGPADDTPDGTVAGGVAEAEGAHAESDGFFVVDAVAQDLGYAPAGLACSRGPESCLCVTEAADLGQERGTGLFHGLSQVCKGLAFGLEKQIRAHAFAFSFGGHDAMIVVATEVARAA